VHAPSTVTYNLNGTCTGNFIADVGVDDEPPANGSVSFQVWINGVMMYDSGLVNVVDLRKPVNLSVSGANELRLVVTDGGNGNGGDHADWGGARVTNCGTTPTATPTATATSTARPTPTATSRPTPTPTTGTATNYRLVVRHSGKVADVSGASTADNAAVVQMAASGAASQDWQFTDMGSGYWRISNRNSGRCLDVSGAATTDGALIIQWACGTGTNQQWQMADLGTGYFHLVARHSGKCLDVPGAATADGTQLVQWACGTGTNQDWQRQSGTPTATPTATPTTATATPTTQSSATATATVTVTATARATATATARATATATSGGAAAWQPNTFYAVGSLVTYNAVTYRCVQAHTSQVGWEPPNAPALWTVQ